MFWMCDVNRFGYYEEHATVFETEQHAETIRRVLRHRGEVRPFTPTARHMPRPHIDYFFDCCACEHCVRGRKRRSLLNEGVLNE
jgi:hypothetical protein